MAMLYFFRPTYNVLWMEFTEEDWTPFNPHSFSWIPGLADYSICLLDGRLRTESDNVYYGSSDLFEQSEFFHDDKEAKPDREDVIVLTPEQRAEKMVYNELIKSFEVYNFKFNQPNL